MRIMSMFPSSHLLSAAWLGLVLLAPAAAQAQTVYSQGATGTTGTTGTTGMIGGGTGGTGGTGGAALDLSGLTSVTAGSYQGGTGGTGGMGGIGFAGGSGGRGGSGTGGAAVVAEANSTVDIYGGTFTFGAGGPGGAGGSGGFGIGPGNVPVIGPSGANGSAGASGVSLLDNGGAITLFGNFTGGPHTLATGTGQFTGTLQNESAAQTFTYNLVSGTITLADPNVVPEPSTWALLVAGAAGLGAATLRRRRAAGA